MDIKLYDDEIKLINQNSFFLFKPYSPKYKINQTINFYNYFTDEYLGNRFLKHIEKYKINELPKNLCYILKNVDKNLFLDIFEQVYKRDLNDNFLLLTFSNMDSKESIETRQKEIYKINFPNAPII